MNGFPNRAQLYTPIFMDREIPHVTHQLKWRFASCYHTRWTATMYRDWTGRRAA